MSSASKNSDANTSSPSKAKPARVLPSFLTGASPPPHKPEARVSATNTPPPTKAPNEVAFDKSPGASKISSEDVTAVGAMHNENVKTSTTPVVASDSVVTASSLPSTLNTTALRNIASKLPVTYPRVVVFDVETTGFGRDDTIIEIGAVEFVNGQLTGTMFHSYVNTPKDIHPLAWKVHKITAEFLKQHPPITEVLPNFLNFVCGSTTQPYAVEMSTTFKALQQQHKPPFDVALVAHNANFDIRMLKQELARLKIPQPEVLLHAFCTKECFGKLFPSEKATLDNACKKFHISTATRQLHGALLDARLTAQLFVAMTRHMLQFADSTLQIVAPGGTSTATSDQAPTVPSSPNNPSSLAADQTTEANSDTNNGTNKSATEATSPTAKTSGGPEISDT